MGQQEAEQSLANKGRLMAPSLNVWDEVLVDYTSGGMFAVARSVGEARKVLLKHCDWIPLSDLNQEPKVYSLGQKPARAIWGGG